VKPTKAGTNLLGSFLRNENAKAAAPKGTKAAPQSKAPASKPTPASSSGQKSERVQKLEKWKARYEGLVKSEKDPKKKAEYQSDLDDVLSELKDTHDSSSCGCGGLRASTKGT
jgi:membrane protein involved in colicin uptake